MGMENSSNVVIAWGLHARGPRSEKGGKAVWVAVATSGREGGVDIVTTWSLRARSTGLLKVAMLLAWGVV